MLSATTGCITTFSGCGKAVLTGSTLAVACSVKRAATCFGELDTVLRYLALELDLDLLLEREAILDLELLLE